MFSEKFWSDYKVPQIFLSLSDSLCPLLKLSMNNNNVRLFGFLKKPKEPYIIIVHWKP